MNISKQLKNYRKKLDISQEGLAEIVHVSRQTISNWENDKSYPDLQSLVLLSEYFEISLDELVKGDIVIMKDELGRNEMQKLTIWSIVNFMVVAFSTVFFVKFKSIIPAITLILGLFLMFWIAWKIEKIKENKDIKTYEEIMAYMKKQEIPKIEEKERKKKIWVQGIVYTLISGVIGFVTAYILMKLIY
ncbi:MAG: helix-turn-helix domain-containing protein [Sarcina sp.]